MIHFVLHDPQDSVAVVVVEGVKAGQDLNGWIMDDDRTISLKARQDVPIGHKLATRDIRNGDTIIKYGHDIGRATLASLRAEVGVLLPDRVLVTGTVRDGLSGLPLVDVQMTEGGVPDGAPSAENGSYSLDLPNGTHPLVATDLAASVEYAPVPFVLTVSGTPLVWDLSLDPPVVHVDGLVANALTGQAVAGAAVTLTGTTADGPKWSATATSGADGRFVVTVYPGVYEVEASDAGYASTNVSLTLGVAANAPVSLVLTPLGSGGTTTGATTWWLVGGVAGAAVLGAIVVLMVRREVRRK